jgi:hypothetical protein
VIYVLAVLVLATWFLPRVFARHCLRLVTELVSTGFVPNTPVEALTGEQARAATVIGRWAIAAALVRLCFWPSVVALVIVALV